VSNMMKGFHLLESNQFLTGYSQGGYEPPRLSRISIR